MRLQLVHVSAARPATPRRTRCAIVVVLASLLSSIATPRVRAASADDTYVLAAGHYARGQWQLAAETFGTFLARHPDHRRVPQALFYRAEALVQLGDLSAAREVFQTFLERAPQDAYALQASFRAAEAAMLLGQFEAAIVELEQFIGDHSDDKLLAFALPYLGDMTLAQGHLATAEQYYRRALKQFPDGGLADDCRLGLARVAMKQTDFASARPLLLQLVERAGSNLADDAQLELAQLEYAAGDDAAACAVCESFGRRFADSPFAPKAQRTHGWALLRSGRFPDALAKFTELHGDASLGLEAKYWSALCHRALGQWSQAAAELQSLLPQAQHQPWEEAAWFHAGDSLIRAGQADAGLDVLSQAQQRWPEGVWTDDGAEAIVRLALDRSQHERVLELSNAFLQKFDGRAIRHRVVRMRAQSFIARKDFDTAVVELEALLAQARLPVDEPAARDADPFVERQTEPRVDLETDRYLLSVAYAGAGRQAEAAELAASVSDEATSPLGVDAYLVRAASLAAVGKHAQALEPLQAYLAARPDGAEAARCRAETALCHARLGNLDAARQAFSQLVDKHPSHETLGPTAEQLAELARTADDLAWARELYDRCAAEDQPAPRRARGAFGAAWCARQGGRRPEARDLLHTLLQVFPDSEVADDAALTLGGLCQQLDEPEPALAAYDRVIRRPVDCPQRPAALLAAAAIHDRLAQNRLAAERYQSFLTDYAVHPQRESVLYQWGWTLRDDERPEASEQAFAQLRLEFPTGGFALDAAYRLAEEAFDASNYDEARTRLDVVLHAPDAGLLASHAWYLAGRIAVAQNRWADAAAAMGELQTRDPDGPLSLQAEYWQTEALFRQHEFAAAAERLEALRQRTAERDEAWLAIVHLRLAQCLAHEQRWAEAREVAAAIAGRYPSFDQLHEADYLLGRSLAAAAEFDLARAVYQRAIEAPAAAKTETAAQAQLMLAETYFHQRDYSAAAREYLAVEILYAFPELQAAALWQAGKCYEQMQKPADAARVYERLAETFPESPYAAQARQRQTELTAARTAPSASR